MKSPIAKFLTILILFVSLGTQRVNSQVVETDPGLISAIIAQTVELSKQLGLINTSQAAISVENAAIQLTLDQIKDYEETMVDYLSQSHNFFQSAQQVISAVDKVSDIIAQLNQCRIAAQEHPQGLIVSTLVSDQYNKILLETTGLVDNVTTLVKGGGKDNLLNSAERLQILYSINAQLHNIYARVRDLRWNILCMKWSDIAREVSPEIYYMLNNTDAAYEGALRTIGLMEKVW